MYSILLNSMIAGFATILGSLIVIFMGRTNEKVLASLLGLATGIMVTVVIIDLLPSAYYYSNFLMAIIGFLLGNLILLTLDLLLTKVFFTHIKVMDDKKRLLKMGYLIAVGIALHDLPEGMAIAVGYSATPELGLIIALAIAIHNIPEGMAATAPLKMGGLKPWKILSIITLVSLITPLGAYLGFIIVSISKSLIGVLIASAAGAMTYIIQSQLWPEAKRRHPNYAHLGAAFGIVLMLIISFTQAFL